MTPADYTAAGFALVPIPHMLKGPNKPRWNLRENCRVPADWSQNIGLAHAYSGTCALDIDDVEPARAYLTKEGVDLDALLAAPDAVQITSGRPNRAKLIYRLPVALPSKTLAEGAFELRCSTVDGLTVQDVLPPSMHPGGTQYRWEGDYTRLPQIPAKLLALWLRLASAKKAEQPTAPQISLEQLREYLFRRSADCEYEVWYKSGQAVHHGTGGSDAGLNLWDEWSQSNGNYPGRRVLESKWKSFDDEKGITWQWLLIGQPVQVSDFSPLAAVDDIDLTDEPTPKLMWPVTTFADLTNYTPRPPLVAGLIPKAEVGMIYGASGSGKTFFAFDIAARIAAGLPWRLKKTKQGPVFYICAEGAGGFRMRAKAFADANKLDVKAIPLLSILAAPDLGDVKQAKGVAAAIKAHGGADLVFVDTLAATSGDAEENTKEGMGPVIDSCKYIHAQTGATVVLIHHAGKDAAKGSRGWSGIKGAMDFEIEISATESMRFAKVTKMKDGPDGEQFAFLLESVLVAYDADSEPVMSCVVKTIELQASMVRKPRGRLQQQVFETIRTLAIANSPPSVGVNAVTDAVLPTLAFDSKKRDTRRQDVTRAVKALAAEDFISISDNVITVYPC